MPPPLPPPPPRLQAYVVAASQTDNPVAAVLADLDLPSPLLSFPDRLRVLRVVVSQLGMWILDVEAHLGRLWRVVDPRVCPHGDAFRVALMSWMSVLTTVDGVQGDSDMVMVRCRSRATCGCCPAPVVGRCLGGGGRCPRRRCAVLVAVRVRCASYAFALACRLAPVCCSLVRPAPTNHRYGMDHGGSVPRVHAFCDGQSRVRGERLAAGAGAVGRLHHDGYRQ